MTKIEYLKKHIYYGLTNLNTGFDSPVIYYFNEEDFKTVLNRVEHLGIGILGIEPWDYDNHYFDTKVYENYTNDSTNSSWYRKAFNEFKATGVKLKYAASFHIP